MSFEADDDEAGFLVRKVRNIFRSLLDATTPSSTTHSIVKSLASALESITGVRLLPLEQKKKKRKSTTTQSSKKKTTTSSGDRKTTSTGKKKHKRGKQATKTKLDEDETTTTSSSKTKKKSTAAAATTKTKKSSAAAQKHLTAKLSSNNPNYRIQRELKSFLQDPPEHLTVTVGKNLRVWIVHMEGIGIYEGESFKLRIQFPGNYPTRPPSVYFLPPNIPTHEHVYTNGDICLSLLGKDWRPTMTAQSIAHSILSILGSASKKTLPMDNARHATNKPGQYQEAWVYHDDSC